MNRYEQPQTNSTTQGKISLTWNKIPGLIGFSFIYFLLRILTLNIYYFWGKTETRRKLWNAVHLQGQPFQYTGTGMELFLGALMVILVILLPVLLVMGAIGNIFGRSLYVEIPLITIFYLGFFYLIGVAVYRARNYQLTRTTWRGIRGSMGGSSWTFGWTYLWTTLASIITLGWLMPWQSNKLQKILTDDTRFGDMPLSYEGSSKPLYGPFAFAWFSIVVLIVITSTLFNPVIQGVLRSGALDSIRSPEMLVLVLQLLYFIGLAILFLVMTVLSSWYVAKTMNHFAACTGFDNARFKMNAQTMSLIWLTISNVLLVFLTLGLATPIAQARTLKYRITRMTIIGTIDFNKVAQSQARLGTTGEGLAEAFDLGAF